jgi:hypothetical protein
MFKKLRTTIMVACVTAGTLVLTAAPAAAHESREVGPYEFLVGWGDEPTFTGSKNSVELTITHLRSGKPLLDLGGELEVDVIFGDASTTLAMEPSFVPGVFGEPGVYEADITPTRAGEYTFHFHGTVEGMDVDEEFTSGPDTFGSPVELQEIMFPVADPSNAELAERLDQEVSRLENAVDVAASVEDDVSSVRTVSFVALGVGLLALVVGIAMMIRSTRSRAATAVPDTSR